MVRAKPKVLVVDDEPDVVTLCQVNLELDGYDVVTAADGREALQVAHDEMPDLVLLDVKMPELDGFEVLQRLQEDPATASIPVVMLTAYSMPGDQIRGWEGGVKDYLTKPFNPATLLRAVKRVLEESTATDESRTRHLELTKLELDRRLHDAS